jgi:hypothetical protein
VTLITNVDQGAVASWELDSTAASGATTKKTYYIATTQGTSVASQNTTASLLTPVLQAQDGTFFGISAKGQSIPAGRL